MVTDKKEVDFIARKIANKNYGRRKNLLVIYLLPVMVISQFTLYGDARKGCRPTWIRAAKGDVAQP